jgi:hypothetical protein
VIVDLFIAPFVWLFSWLVNLLPDHTLTLPSNATMVTWLGRVDSYVPIGPVVAVAVTLLGFAAAFILWRLVVMVRHIVLP